MNVERRPWYLSKPAIILGLFWIMFVGLTLLWVCTAGGCGFHPFLPPESGAGGFVGPPSPTSPFVADLRHIVLPIAWLAILGGGAIIALGFTVGLWNPRLCLMGGGAAIVSGIALLWLLSVVTAHPWIIPVTLGGVVAFLAWPTIHAYLLKRKGAVDSTSMLDAIKSVIPGATPNVQPPTLSNPVPA